MRISDFYRTTKTICNTRRSIAKGADFWLPFYEGHDTHVILEELRKAVQSGDGKAFFLAREYVCAGELWLRQKAYDFCNDNYAAEADRLANLRKEYDLDSQLAQWGFKRKTS